jgi:hypothetical protein
LRLSLRLAGRLDGAYAYRDAGARRGACADWPPFGWAGTGRPGVAGQVLPRDQRIPGSLKGRIARPSTAYPTVRWPPNADSGADHQPGGPCISGDLNAYARPCASGVIYRAIHVPAPAFSEFRQPALTADPSTPSRRPGALVTSRQDLLITVRAVITTVRLRPGLVDGTVVRVRISRRYFALCKYLVTCDVRAWQLNSKVSAPYGH